MDIEKRFQNVLDLFVRANLMPITAGLGALYVVFAVSYAFVLPTSLAPLMIAIAAVTAAILLALTVLLYKQTLPIKWVNPLGAGIAALVLLNSLAYFYFVNNLNSFWFVFLLVIACSFLFLSIQWFAVIVSLSLGGWIYVSWTMAQAPGLLHFGFAIFTATALSLVVHTARIRLLGRLEGIRLQEEEQQQALDYQWNLQKLVTTISTEFISLSTEMIDKEINEKLGTIGEFARVDRSYIFLFSDDYKYMSNTHEWCAPGIEQEKDKLQNLKCEDVPWWTKKLLNFENIHIPDVESLPAEADTEKMILQAQDIQSVLAVPLMCAGSLIGFLGFDSVKKQRTWSEDIISLMRICGDIFANALERKRIEEAIKLERKRIYSVLENIPALISLQTADGEIQYANRYFRNLYGNPVNIKADVLFGRPSGPIGRLSRQQGSQASTPVEWEWRSKNGRIFQVLDYSFQDVDGTPVLLRLGIDISEKKESEQALQQRDRLLMASAEANTYLMSYYDDEEVWQKILKILGKAVNADRVYIFENSIDPASGDHLMSQRFEWSRDCISAQINNPKLQNLSYEKCFPSWYKELSQGNIISGFVKNFSQEIRRILEPQDILSILVVPIITDGKFWGFIGFDDCHSERKWLIGEISILKTMASSIGSAIAQKQAQRQIQASLREKTVLLKEVHHRVKNNMQVISSLLNLQAQHIQDKEARAMFEDSRNRVKSMALIHEKLYQSENLAQIDFAAYIKNLTQHLASSYFERSRRIDLDLKIQNVLLGVDQAIPCGLIINELVSNALKHAFPRQKEGKIRIVFQSDGNGGLNLEVSDNGIGLPKSIKLEESETLGLQLVTTLVNQLDGNLEIKRNGGTSFRIDFGCAN